MHKITKQLIKISLILLISNHPSYSSDSICSPVKAHLTSMEGTVAIAYQSIDWHPAKLGAPLCEESIVKVGRNSRAALSLIGDIVLRLDQNTTVRLVDLTEKPEDRSIIDLLIGAIQSFSRSPRKLAVNTPFLNGMIEGTEFLTRVDSDKTDITVFEGKVIAVNEQGSLTLTRGKSAEAKKGQAPQAKILVRPRDAVQWALYYPPVIDFDPNNTDIDQPWRDDLRQSIESYQSGDLQKAFAFVSKFPETLSDPSFLSYRASLYLSVGRIEKANTDIERILQKQPDYSNALALQTIIKVVQNQPQDALVLAQQAVNKTRDSPAVLLAFSYAQQAVFNLEGARETVNKITRLQPNNALAWARLAELHSSFGELDEAQKAAEKAASINPNLSRTQTVLGFAQLQQIDTASAKQSFEKAIAFAPSDPLPKLGLGLAKIRDGDLAEGRRDLEIAAGLDPNNAIVRSYLGKAYYEEKRQTLADREYETAKELDPNDPTPYFYDAIEKQTTNRPVEALHDLQKAIDLNDNRAVYRSSLMLDSDLAARSASLARIYSDLGFEKRALVEGWKSVNTDPSNFSAHRFLADSYSALPRHEIARVSELLQSQLLQPLNMTPIQPRLAESNLFLISSSGPASLSFNEFNPIYNRDGLTFQSSGLVGENNTYAGEGVVSGILNKASFSFGGLHFSSDGFRQNADQEDDIGTAFIQYEISPQTSIQAEYRYRNSEYGDLNLRFFPENFFPGERNREERHTYRLGMRHSFTPSSIVLGSFTYQDTQLGLTDNQPPEPDVVSIDLARPEEAFGAEVQHLFRSQYVNLTTGVGFFDVNGKIDALTVIDFPPPIAFPATVDTDVRHVNAYTYSYIHPVNDVVFTLGVSGDFLDGDSPDFENTDQINPKFGITWEPVSGTLLRAAAFRTLKRTLITNQTLEPTQVAGFNQFFDDINGTDAWRYGGAIDQQFGKDIYAGIEFSKRDLRVPFVDFSNPANPASRRADWDEYLGRAYVYWTPHPWLALRTEYQFERARRNAQLTDGVREMDTHRVPIGISFFHPSGLGTMLKATYFHQDGQFELISGNLFKSGSSNFWVLDAAMSYRLPKRYGLFTFGAANLLDRKFNYFDTDVGNPIVQPTRTLFARVTFALP